MYNRAKHIDTRIYRIRELASGDHPEIDVLYTRSRANFNQQASSPRGLLVWPSRDTVRH